MATGLEKLAQLQGIRQSKMQTEIMGESLLRTRKLRSAGEATVQPTSTLQGQEPTEAEVTSSYGAELRKRGLIVEADEYEAAAATRAYNITKAQLQGAASKVNSMAAAMEMVDAGNIQGGIELLNILAPQGKKIIGMEQTKKPDIFLVRTQDNPKGSLQSKSKTLRAAVDAKTRFEMDSRIRLRAMEDKVKLKAGEFRVGNGDILNHRIIRDEYKTEFSLVDEKDLLLMKIQNPAQHRIEIAKRAAAPSFRDWIRKAYGTAAAAHFGGGGEMPQDMTEKYMSRAQELYPHKTRKEIIDAYTGLQRK